MRKAVALLLTLFFIILISVAIGYALKINNEAKKQMQLEKFMIQNTFILNDILEIFRNSPQINEILKDNTPISFNTFLTSSSFITFNSSDYKIIIQIKSARDKFNINALKNSDNTINQARFNAFKKFLTNHQIDTALSYMIVDSMLGIKKDMTYYSDIFLKNPNLFRDYIASYRQLKTILLYYSKKYYDNIFKKLDFKSFLAFDKNSNTSVDLNYATPLTWQFLTGCSKERAVEFYKNSGIYQSIDDIGLNKNEKERLKKFKISFLEPIIKVNIDINYKELNGKIIFIYNLKTKRAYHFVYTI